MSAVKSGGGNEITPGPVDEAASLQDSDGSNSAAVMSASSINLPLIVSLPILLIVVTAIIIIIMILVWCLYKSKKKKSGYKSVPTECVDAPPNKPSSKTSSKPSNKPSSKPKVHLSDPPVPGVTTQFIEAAQLGSVDGTGLGSRYPFIKSSKSSAEKEKRPQRKLSSRRAKPLGLSAARRAQSTDRSSDGSEDGYSSPRRPFPRGTAWGSSATTPAETPSPEHRLPRAISGPSGLIEQRPETLPGLGLCLVFNEKEAQLTVKVERATKLPHRPNGDVVDSYVRLYFVPKLAEMPQRKTAKTEIVRGNCEPVFDQAVQYEAMTMAELINSVLHVEVLDIPDSTGFGKHQVLGRSDLPLVQVQFIAGEAPLTLSLSPPIVSHLLLYFMYIFGGCVISSISFLLIWEDLGAFLSCVAIVLVIGWVKFSH